MAWPSPTSLADAAFQWRFPAMSLEMRSDCGSCGAALPADGTTFICSYVCTFCERCAESGAR